MQVGRCAAAQAETDYLTTEQPDVLDVIRAVDPFSVLANLANSRPRVRLPGQRGAAAAERQPLPAGRVPGGRKPAIGLQRGQVRDDLFQEVCAVACDHLGHETPQLAMGHLHPHQAPRSATTSGSNASGAAPATPPQAASSKTSVERPGTPEAGEVDL